MLSKESITEYKKLYKKRYGVDLSDDEAVRRANNLVNLYKAVYQSMPYSNKLEPLNRDFPSSYTS